MSHTCRKCGAKLLPYDEECSGCGELVPEPTASGADPRIGRVIGDKYQLLEHIGEGAMGQVYKARQTSLEKLVAIKLLRAHLANDPKVARRFHREARTASRLSHPNSLQMIDFGTTEDGELYIAMELLEGTDLLKIIKRDAPLTPTRIGHMLKQILAALAAAHHAGIVHRDLKPENVLVVKDPATGEELVKVCDFGIAKIQEVSGGSQITVSGFVCGTPEFMAPEQARGEELDSRADIYAAGCMLYQMLTGVVPFVADSALGIITKHLTEKPIPPRQRAPHFRIPRSLEIVALKAMNKEPRDRYSTAAEMSAALMNAVRGLGDSADTPLGSFDTTDETPPASVDIPLDSRKRFAPYVVAAIGALAIGAVAAYVTASGDDPVVTPIAPARGAPDAAAAVLPLPTVDAAVTADDASPPVDAAIAVDITLDAARPVRDAAREPRDAAIDVSEPPDAAPPPEEDAAEPLSPGAAAFEEGRRLFLRNDVDGAIARFEEAATLMPGTPDVQKQLGRAYMRRGDVARAQSAYRRYLELAPNAPDRAVIESILSQ